MIRMILAAFRRFFWNRFIWPLLRSCLYAVALPFVGCIIFRPPSVGVSLFLLFAVVCALVRYCNLVIRIFLYVLRACFRRVLNRLLHLFCLLCIGLILLATLWYFPREFIKYPYAVFQFLQRIQPGDLPSVALSVSIAFISPIFAAYLVYRIMWRLVFSVLRLLIVQGARVARAVVCAVAWIVVTIYRHQQALHAARLNEAKTASATVRNTAAALVLEVGAATAPVVLEEETPAAPVHEEGTATAVVVVARPKQATRKVASLRRSPRLSAPSYHRTSYRNL